jgi:copper chaperone CopZ
VHCAGAGIAADIAEVKAALKKVEGVIEKKEAFIEKVEAEIAEETNADEKNALRKREDHLREEKKQLRDKEKLLLEEKKLLLERLAAKEAAAIGGTGAPSPPQLPPPPFICTHGRSSCACSHALRWRTGILLLRLPRRCYGRDRGNCRYASCLAALLAAH